LPAHFRTTARSGIDTERDVIALQVVTVGQKTSDTARLVRHGLSVEMAEAMAEYVHKRIREELGFANEDDRDMEKMLAQGYRGSRYSFGYPACPRLEDQVPILGHQTMRSPTTLSCHGVTATDRSGQLRPQRPADGAHNQRNRRSSRSGAAQDTIEPDPDQRHIPGVRISFPS
jgi:hypothetical protein